MFIKARQKLLGKKKILTFQQAVKHFTSNLTDFKNMVLMNVGEVSTCILIIKSTCVVQLYIIYYILIFAIIIIPQKIKAQTNQVWQSNEQIPSLFLFK